jgi:glycosyltransferase involved in cell wall biosynthesis
VRLPSTCVVIPSFNHRPFVGAAVESVLGQSRQADEIVVVDDGSTDGSADVLAAFAERGVRVVFQANAGAHAALTRGIDLTTAELIFILNSDDLFASDRIETFAGLFAGDPGLALAGSWVEVIDGKGRSLGVKRAWENMEPWPMAPRASTFQGCDDPCGNLLQANYLASTSNFVLRRAVWERHRPFAALRFAHDWELALRVAARERIAVLPRALLRYRSHAGNTIASDRAAMELEVLWVTAASLGAFLARSPAAPQDGDAVARYRSRIAHSVQVFGRHRLLAVLVGLAAADPAAFAALLDPADATRCWLLAEIG